MTCGQCRHCIGEHCIRWVWDEETPVVGAEDGCGEYEEDEHAAEFELL